MFVSLLSGVGHVRLPAHLSDCIFGAPNQLGLRRRVRRGRRVQTLGACREYIRDRLRPWRHGLAERHGHVRRVHAESRSGVRADEAVDVAAHTPAIPYLDGRQRLNSTRRPRGGASAWTGRAIAAETTASPRHAPCHGASEGQRNRPSADEWARKPAITRTRR